MKALMFAVIAIVLVIPVSGAVAEDDLAAHPSCAYCGMDRAKFAHSRMLVRYVDGTSTGTCSIRDAALDLAVKIDTTPTEVLVSDFNTKELIAADKAIWVIGGDVKGVMTNRPKWAFNGESSAQAFIKEHGGEIVSFGSALKAAYEDMYEDTNMIRKMRSMKKMEKGM